jgi:hypothetical protein
MRGTVRYRLRQVEDLFGDQLRDPDRRFELEIGLAGAAYAPPARVLTVSRPRAATGSGPGQRGQHFLAAWSLESGFRTTNPDSAPSLLVCTGKTRTRG